MTNTARLLAAILLAALMAAAPARAGEAAEQAARAVTETLVHDAHGAMAAAVSTRPPASPG